MTSIALTKAHQFWPLTAYLEGLGVPVSRYIEQYHLPGKMLEAPDLFIDEARFWELADSLGRREGLLDWGYRAGRQLDLNVLGEFGTMLLQQPSLKAGLELFVAAIKGETLHVSFGLMPQGNHCWITMSGYHNAPAGRNVIELYDLQFLITLVRSATGSHWLPPAVHLQADSLPQEFSREKICTGKIRYSSTMTAIAVPQELMALPMNQYISSVITDEGSVNRPDGADFASNVRLLMAGYLSEALSIGDCADMVSMTKRTLQRRLADQETTFGELMDQVRFDTAKHLLQDQSNSISTICYELGFANPANFTRAFRRWAGVSPRQYRNNNQLIS